MDNFYLIQDNVGDYYTVVSSRNELYKLDCFEDYWKSTHKPSRCSFVKFMNSLSVLKHKEKGYKMVEFKIKPVFVGVVHDWKDW